MTDRNKIKLVQALAGAIVLTLLMQVMGLVGFGEYTWMCFLPLLMFFAFGANFKMIPEMIVSYIVGELWCIINGLVMGLFTNIFGPDNFVMTVIIPTIIVIFCILTIHENFFEGKIFSNVPCIFMGMATSFFITGMGANTDPILFVELLGFWLYGLVLAVALVLVGMFVCRAIFGEERAMAALMPLPKEGAPAPAPEAAPAEKPEEK